MRKSSHWFEQSAPDQPVSKVARRAIDKRLKCVWHDAKRAAKKSEDDIEHVHQLRVSTRRARAALRLFGDVFPGRRARWLNRTLRDLRLAANWMTRAEQKGQRKLTSKLSQLIDNEQLSSTSQAFRVAWTDRRAAELKARL